MTPFDKEVSDEDFIQAIEDTITALKTGKAKDRRDRNVQYEGLPISQLSDPEVRKKMRRVADLLQQVRDVYNTSVALHISSDHGEGTDKGTRIFEYKGKFYRSHRDGVASAEIDRLRMEAMTIVNAICLQYGIDERPVQQ
jgi:hypothetical protein